MFNFTHNDQSDGSNDPAYAKSLLETFVELVTVVVCSSWAALTETADIVNKYNK